MIPGMGAVATTFVAGVEAVRKGISSPIGSLTQMGTIRLGKRTEGRSPKIKDFVPLAGLNDLVFTGWDIFEDDMYAAAGKAGVLDRSLLEQVKPFLSSIKPRKAVFDKNYVKKLDGPNVKKGKNKMELAEQVRDDIREFKQSSGADRLVMIWCGSTETFIEASAAHKTVEALEKAHACQRREHCAFDDLCLRRAEGGRALRQRRAEPHRRLPRDARALASRYEAPICGKDFKTGQTLMKTILAPGFKARMLGLSGWFSTNILGNRDGEVLDDPGSFKTKEESKLGARAHPAAGALSRALREHLPQGPHQLLPAARRQQRGLGQHRHLRLARLSDADQGRLPLPRLDPRGAARARPGAVPRPGAALAGAARHRHPGVAELLLQEPDDGARASTPSTTCSSSR